MLNLSQVEVFLAILDAGGFKQAAVRLGYSQPTVSQQLRRLEKELGVQLIVRHRARPTVTAHGERFLPYARRLLETAQRVPRATQGDSLVVGASSNIGVYFLQRALRSFASTNPELLPTEVRIGSNPEIVEQIVAGQIDVAVLEWWAPKSGMLALPWRRERLVVIVAPDHPLAMRNSITTDVLLATPMLGGEPGTGTGTLLRNVLGDRAREMKVSQNLGSTEAVKRAVRSGLGVSLVLEGTVADEVQHGNLVAIPVEGVSLEKEFQIVLPEDTPPTARAWQLVNLLTGQGVRGQGRAAHAGGPPYSRPTHGSRC
ncbi:MAG: LysR family transcriptional regulator [Terriglobales bacterium]